MTEQPQRLRQSDVIRMLLERGSSEHSSVTISRNSKGDAQFEVVVRATADSAIATPQEAERVACEVYDRLAQKYPYVGVPVAR